MFGEWTVHGDFQSAEPFPHCILDSFFTEDAFAELLREFGSPTSETGWNRYWNPIEKKYTLNTFTSRPHTTNVFAALQSDAFVQRIAALTGIPMLQSDPHLHGAGLHYHPRGGKLDMHLDYSIHPITGLERRVNLIVYLNDTWDAAWGGALELWDREFTHCVTSIPPLRNRAVLFRTSDISYHGLPHPVQCPEGLGRQSLAVYYVAPIETTSVSPRKKAEFRPLPTQVVDERLARLYEIRKTRLLCDDDLKEGAN
jgi:hypothetical protein